MPKKTARSRARAPAYRTFSSLAPLEQVKFPPRERRIKARHNLRAISPSRQQTLTQMIDFTECEEYISDDSEDSYEMDGRNRKTKRRRTGGDEPSSATRHHTQTLTQLKFFSDPSDEPQNQSSNGEMAPRWVVGPSAGMPDAAAGNRAIHSRDAPRTPLKDQQYEVPSSQYSATPFSSRGRFSNRRLPLAERNMNLPVDASPSHFCSTQKLPTLELWGRCDFVEDSQERVLSTPAKDSSVAKVSVVSEPHVKSEPTQKLIKVEIEDSEEERDDEPDNDFGLGMRMEVEALLRASKARSSPTSHVREEVARHENQSQSRSNQHQYLLAEDIAFIAQRSDKLDIIISIYPNHVANIVNRTKDHEFRTYQIPNKVKRMWIYETAPSSTLKYMASVGAAKKPGQISDLSGIGNAEFNTYKRGSHYAYEIFQVYKLSDPLSLGTLKAKGWIKTPPQKYVYVQPAMLDHLLSNLESSVFKDPSRQPRAEPSDALETEAQLHSTIFQFSRFPSSPTRSGHPRPSQATTVGLTQASSPPPRPHTASSTTAPVVIPNTPSSPHHHRSPYALPPQTPTLMQSDSQARGPPVPLSFASSQLLTHSQMLPDSLINDDLPLPPPFIEDSDFEE